MSKTKTLAAAVLASSLTLSTAAQAQSLSVDPEMLDNPAFTTAESLFMLNVFMPPEIKALVAGATLKVEASLSADAEGNFKQSFSGVTIENLDCTALEALIGDEMPSTMEKSMLAPEELLMVEYAETLFADRKLVISDKFDKAAIMTQMDPMELALLPSEVEINVSVTCSDYIAPAPTMTPVEPN